MTFVFCQIKLFAALYKRPVRAHGAKQAFEISFFNEAAFVAHQEAAACT